MSSNQIKSTWTDRWSTFSASVMDGFNRFFLVILGNENVRRVRKMGYIRANSPGAKHTVVPGSQLDQINKLEPTYQAMSDADLAQTTIRLRQKLAGGAQLDSLLPEAFAAVRESAKRSKEMRHYDVQMIGGIVLHQGGIAEMMTGEGKTLVATLPAYLNGLTGRGVHVITVNDYLSRRDCEWMLPIFRTLGMEAAFIQSNMDPDGRRRAYDCDITYGTSSEFGFDYLRDNMKQARRGDNRYPPHSQQVMRMERDPRTDEFRLHYAIIDEVDNILIDEARTPLIISGQAFTNKERYDQANQVALKLSAEEKNYRHEMLIDLRVEMEKSPAEYEDPSKISPDGLEGEGLPILPRKRRKPGDPAPETGVLFEVREKEHSVFLTEKGIRRAEELVGVESFFTAGNTEWPHLMDNALRAQHLYRRNKQYAVMQHPDSGELSVIIIDENTGRLMVGRQWSEGLHQAVESKHLRDGVQIKEETQTLATITLQNFFKLYYKVGGMTGTAKTEETEFRKIYGLDVVTIPTNRPLIRKEHNDVVYRTGREKWDAVTEEVLDVNKTGRPILIGTTDVEKSLSLSALLKKKGIRHELLNALPEHAAREADIVAQAGRVAAVTISTNMAGRGTDIVLGGNPETMAWARLKGTYPSRLDIPEDIWKRTVDEIESKEKMREEGRRVAELGGLHIIGTERHDSRRIDNQLRGRAGRQGDPGSGKFFIALDDDLMRRYNGEFVARVMTSMGMKDGEAVEGRFLSKQIEKSQRRVEQLHFQSRKDLLEFDEVMNAQRKRVYGLRQRLLNDENPRLMITEFLERMLKATVARFLNPEFGPSRFAEFAKLRSDCNFTANDFFRCEYPDARDLVRRRAIAEAGNQIHDVLEEALQGEDSTEWNWQALRQTLERKWGLVYREDELRKFDRIQLSERLVEAVRDKVDKLPLDDGRDLLDSDYGINSLIDWLGRSFQVEVLPAELKGLDPNKANQLILSRLLEKYREKDALFPVMVSLSRFMPLVPNPFTMPNDREGLLAWARHRFPGQIENLPENDFRTESRDRLGEIILDTSVHALPSITQEELLAKADEILAHSSVVEPEDAQELADWVNQNVTGLTLTSADFSGLSPEFARNLVIESYDQQIRPEMHRMERNLLVNQIDQHWKQHLRTMDQLRATIHLRGYGQEDPKTVYKREGMQEFERMMEVARDTICELAFRMEEAGEVEDSIWVIDELVHAAPPKPAAPLPQLQGNNGPDGAPPAKIEQATKSGLGVGRNETCPCGSGKKYKNCCMRSVAN